MRGLYIYFTEKADPPINFQGGQVKTESRSTISRHPRKARAGPKWFTGEKNSREQH